MCGVHYGVWEEKEGAGMFKLRSEFWTVETTAGEQLEGLEKCSRCQRLSAIRVEVKQVL